MKKSSISYIILFPISCVLIIGFILLIILTGYQSSRTTTRLNTEIISQTVNYHANVLQTSAQNALSCVISTAPMLNSIREVENSREIIAQNFAQILEANDNILGIWTFWYPNAFDGNDAQYRNTAFHDQTGRYVPFIFRNADGQIEYEAGINYDEIILDLYHDTLLEGNIFFTDPYHYKNYLLYSYVMPIIENGKVAGAVGVDVDLSELSRSIEDAKVLDEGYIFIINKNNLITAHPNTDFLLTPYTDYWLNQYESEINQILNHGGTIQFNTFNTFRFEEALSSPPSGRPSAKGENVILTIEGINILDSYWAVCSIVPNSAVNRAALDLMALCTAIGIVIIVAVSIAIVHIVRKNLNGLKDITQQAVALSKGDIGGIQITDISPATDTKNEIALLQHAFNNMIVDIKKQVNIIQKISSGDLTVKIRSNSNNDVLNNALQQFITQNSHVFNEINLSTEQISVGAANLSDSAYMLAQSTVEQNVSIEELSATVQEIEENAVSNENLSYKAAELSTQAQSIAELSIEKMELMIHAVNEITEANQLIGQAIKTVDDITFQTKILSINAAVEAAHAGVNAQGFAVIANEIRNLAEKSAIVAAEIGNLTKDSIYKSELGTIYVEETSNMLMKIIQNIFTCGETVEKIPISSKQQAESIKLIRSGIQDVLQGTQQSSSIAEENVATSEDLKRQVQILQNLISRFNYKP